MLGRRSVRQRNLPAVSRFAVPGVQRAASSCPEIGPGPVGQVMPAEWGAGSSLALASGPPSPPHSVNKWGVSWHGVSVYNGQVNSWAETGATGSVIKGGYGTTSVDFFRCQQGD